MAKLNKAINEVWADEAGQPKDESSEPHAAVACALMLVEAAAGVSATTDDKLLKSKIIFELQELTRRT